MLCVPFIGSIYWLGDEGMLLTGATRLLKGSRLYVDFFEALPPGGDVLTAAWFDMVGTSNVVGEGLSNSMYRFDCLFHLSDLLAGIRAYTRLRFSCSRVGDYVTGFLDTGQPSLVYTLFSMVAASAAIASVQHTQQWQQWSVIAGIAAGAAEWLLRRAERSLC